LALSLGTALMAGREPDLPEAPTARRVPVLVTAEREPVPPERAGLAEGAAFLGGAAAVPVASSSLSGEGGSAERKEESMM
jgi:hypothetical protein